MNQAQVDAEADEAEARAKGEQEKANTLTEEEFRKLSPMEMNEFYRKGGKVKV